MDRAAFLWTGRTFWSLLVWEGLCHTNMAQDGAISWAPNSSFLFFPTAISVLSSTGSKSELVLPRVSRQT
jgi:hypothetical protein